MKNDRLLHVEKGLFVAKETAMSLLLEVKFFPLRYLLPGVHRRRSDAPAPGVGIVGTGFDVDFPGGYGVGYIQENPIRLNSLSNADNSIGES